MHERFYLMSGVQGPLETRVKTTVETTADLEALDATPFDSGELAYVKITILNVGQLYRLDREDTTTPVDGFNTLSVGPSGSVGRWKRFVGAAGPAGATGVTGATGSAGSPGPSIYDFTGLEQLPLQPPAAVLTVGFPAVSLLTENVVVTPAEPFIVIWTSSSGIGVVGQSNTTVTFNTDIFVDGVLTLRYTYFSITESQEPGPVTVYRGNGGAGNWAVGPLTPGAHTVEVRMSAQEAGASPGQTANVQHVSLITTLATSITG